MCPRARSISATDVTSDHVVSVALPVPLRRDFDYRLPADAPAVPAVGGRVRVPFGSRRLIGVVTRVVAGSARERELRDVLEVIDDVALIPDRERALLEWSARYYHHPLGEVLWTALPTKLRRGDPVEKFDQSHWRITDAGRGLPGDQPGGAKLQRRLLAQLRQGPAEAETLRNVSSSWRQPLSRLVESGWVEAVDGPRPDPGGDAAPTLNAEQKIAVSTIAAERENFRAWVLDGVTGSGKTEVYLALIEKTLESGRGVLVLVPEIGLTPQLMQRFRRRLAARILALHSGLNDGERARAWVQARAGQVDVIVATRSGVFTPHPRLGLIVVDEEHDLSFKQQDGFRYHARDVAVRRAQQLGCAIVLGSATPSLETMAHAKSGRYGHLLLSHRAGPAQPPRFALLDVRRQRLRDGLSEGVLSLIGEVLGNGEQVLVFINRRGYAPVLLCGDCGWHAECERCDANLTWHRAVRELRCHHCDSRRAAPDRCSQCDHAPLTGLGEGTERLEDLLRERFPEVSVLRADRDSTRRKGDLERLLARARGGEACILVGTQMLAKGHDFPRVTLVVVVNVDQALYSSDFRGPERLAQLIVQVAGRAGRGELPGAVALQTLQPSHPLFATLIERGYRAFAEEELQVRARVELPPSNFLALLRAEAPRADRVYGFLDDAAASLGDRPAAVEVLGPMAAPMARRAGVQRGLLLLQSPDRRPLHAALAAWVRELERLKAGRVVRWSLDVDPQEMF